MPHEGVNESLELNFRIGATSTQTLAYNIPPFDIARYFGITSRDFDWHAVLESARVVGGPGSIQSLVMVVDDPLEGKGRIVGDNVYVVDLDEFQNSGSRSRKVTIFESGTFEPINAVFYQNGRSIYRNISFIRTANSHQWNIALQYHLEPGAMDLSTNELSKSILQVIPEREVGGPFFQPQKEPGDNFFKAGGQR